MRSPISRTPISVAAAFIAGTLLMPAVASAKDNVLPSRSEFKRECERQGGTFAEGKNSEGKTVWVCIKRGTVIADCELDGKGHGACTVPRDWPKNDGSSPAGSESRPPRTGPAQYIDDGASFQSSSSGDGPELLDVGQGQEPDQGSYRAPTSP